mmetsp:Transcript_57470/g.140261  ORF Transcript_57470/g.140261 Transcript_57470/m.140261 type:complete len:282 (-) Transcript_57470:945-1790(-)
MSYRIAITLGLLLASLDVVISFSPFIAALLPCTSRTSSPLSTLWVGQGDVLDDELQPGALQGFTIRPVGGEGDGDISTEWVVQVDGHRADLGAFSKTIFGQIIADAKKQRFQGYRPGTIPPHLQRTYTAFAMNEVAREVVMEAMDQSKIRPFTDARESIKIEDVSFIKPLPSKKSSKKKKGGRKGKSSKKIRNKQDASGEVNEQTSSTSEESSDADKMENAEDSKTTTDEPEWIRCDNLDEAITAGWKPGQPFNFVAKNVRGQKVLSSSDTAGARPLGGLR